MFHLWHDVWSWAECKTFRSDVVGPCSKGCRIPYQRVKCTFCPDSKVEKYLGHAVAQLVEALPYKPKGRGSVCWELLTGKVVRGVNNLRKQSERQWGESGRMACVSLSGDSRRVMQENNGQTSQYNTVYIRPNQSTYHRLWYIGADSWRLTYSRTHCQHDKNRRYKEASLHKIDRLGMRANPTPGYKWTSRIQESHRRNVVSQYCSGWYGR